jgi:hypothetical protein
MGATHKLNPIKQYQLLKEGNYLLSNLLEILYPSNWKYIQSGVFFN